VLPLSGKQVSELGANEDEKEGVCMEIVSPGPPNVLSGKVGIASAAEFLGVLVRQGIQAGPSQGLHVHVNAISSAAPGAKLDMKGIASVWFAWAKYQLVIDEMLSPNRPDNTYSGRLFLAGGRPWENHLPVDCRDDAATCTAYFFMNMRKHIDAITSEDQLVLASPSDSMDFCNAVFKLEEDERACEERYAHQRYFQVNLLPLTRYGTIEFRAHSATTKLERVTRWVQFLTAFVEYFGNTREGLAETAPYFDEDRETDFSQLRDAQRSATLSALFGALGDAVDSASFKYYSERIWEEEDVYCNADKVALLKKEKNRGRSMLELRSDFEDRKVEIGKRQRHTPVEIRVQVPQDD
jgi:hypothetical protein